MNAHELAERFFIHAWADESVYLHSKCVFDVCKELSKEWLDMDVFSIAAWIHDMGKKIEKENHHLKSIRFLDEFLTRNPQFIRIKGEIVDCIANHRSEGKPATEYGQIFKIADKMALQRKEWKEYVRECEMKEIISN
jgi:HD superfamily phosphodiesterase